MKGRFMRRGDKLQTPPDYVNTAGRRWGGDRSRGRVTVTAHIHPLVRQFFGHLNLQATTMRECADRAGLAYGCVKEWRVRFSPNLRNFEAALNVLDLELVIVPRGAVLPAHIVSERKRATDAAPVPESRRLTPKAPKP